MANPWSFLTGNLNQKIQASPMYSDQFKQQVHNLWGIPQQPSQGSGGFLNKMWGNIFDQMRNSPIYSDAFKQRFAQAGPLGQGQGPPLHYAGPPSQPAPFMPQQAPLNQLMAGLQANPVETYESMKAKYGVQAARDWERNR